MVVGKEHARSAMPTLRLWYPLVRSPVAFMAFTSNKYPLQTKARRPERHHHSHHVIDRPQSWEEPKGPAEEEQQRHLADFSRQLLRHREGQGAAKADVETQMNEEEAKSAADGAHGVDET